MKIISMNLAELRVPDRNMRIHSKKQIEEFKRSVQMFGQIRPIVADENNVILCGNGLYMTLKEMGQETVDVYKVAGLSENQKKKLMMADNKIYGLGIDDIDVFDQFINELKDDLDIPGYDEEILQSMIADAEEITEKISEYGTIDHDTIETLQENHERKEMKMQQQSEPSALNQATEEEPKSPATNDKDTPSDNNRAFVICPDCGCKIWL